MTATPNVDYPTGTVYQPDEARYRRLRTSNAKIRTLLATEGVRALLVGSGFEEADALLNAESADVATVRAGLEALLRLKASRAAAAGPILRVRPPGDAAAGRRKLGAAGLRTWVPVCARAWQSPALSPPRAPERRLCKGGASAEAGARGGRAEAGGAAHARLPAG